MANQIQLLLLLVLAKSSFPDRIIQFLTDNEFASFSLNILFKDLLPINNYSPEVFEGKQKDHNLSVIGVESSHSFTNIQSLLESLLIFVIIHTILL